MIEWLRTDGAVAHAVTIGEPEVMSDGHGRSYWRLVPRCGAKVRGFDADLVREDELERRRRTAYPRCLKCGDAIAEARPA